MRVVQRYSHLNGEEYLIVHHKSLWEEILADVDSVDAQACRTKVSKERTRQGKLLYSPIDLNKAMSKGFHNLG